ncbi:AAA family ATPase [Clostridium oryzae]|uniref:ATPase RavA n=1 Tax=Clostridium oryzae TaxID=1450648 RepID=A0A1V4IT43_9CLOT|nr:MoxR family ATPase [Clostridium oryzae]OPJ63073.1 ATPase RavA [Clostridium oryzae]
MEEKEIEGFINRIADVEKEIEKVIVGQKDIIKQVLIVIFSGGNVLLEGSPGLGKTQLVKTIAKTMDLTFSRIQFTPDLMPADVVGTNIITKNEKGSSAFEFHKGPVFANLVLADEINRATPKTQSAMLEAMQEHTVTVGGSTYKLQEPFMVLATQNPLENEGTYPLPEAQLDRFLFKLMIPYPDLEELREIIDITVNGNSEEVRTVMRSEEILKIRELLKQIPIAKPVEEYALRLVLATHADYAEAPELSKKYVRFGASPRAAQAIISTAKVKAAMEGRYNVAFDDIKYVAVPALRHRFFMNFDAVADGVSSENVIEEILTSQFQYA